VKIDDVRLFRVQGSWRGSGHAHGSRQSQPLDVYAEFNERGSAARPASDDLRGISAIYLEIQADDGTTGVFGPIQRSQAFVIHEHLRSFLLGRDPLATEALQDQMLRMNRHGRSGMFMTGVSPVDCALWDLKGKSLGLPIWRLLGGPTRDSVPAYASMLGFSIEPADAAATATEYKAQGYGAQKWFFRHGPTDGYEGQRRNVRMAEAVREAVGDGYPLMFDAYNGWTVQYATEMVRLLEPIRPAWMEEPIPPERVGELRRIRAAARVPIATGEHVYTRWQTKELLVGEAVDVLQNDPDWTGGITELVKVCALASAFEVPVVAHGHSLLAALHVAASQSPVNVPYVEYLVQGQPSKQYFHKPAYSPSDGEVALPTLPGLGLVLDDDKIQDREELTF
jgi:L-alanine-DL-glutamate epimerase-like enolase superfamily enzyme